jgi:hypothetical protein
LSVPQFNGEETCGDGHRAREGAENSTDKRESKHGRNRAMIWHAAHNLMVRLTLPLSCERFQ